MMAEFSKDIKVIVIEGSLFGLGAVISKTKIQHLNKKLFEIFDDLEKKGIPVIITATNGSNVNLADVFEKIFGRNIFLYKFTGKIMNDTDLPQEIARITEEFFRYQRINLKWTRIHRKEKCLSVIFIAKEETSLSPVLISRETEKIPAIDRDTLKEALESLELDSQID